MLFSWKRQDFYSIVQIPCLFSPFSEFLWWYSSTNIRIIEQTNEQSHWRIVICYDIKHSSSKQTIANRRFELIIESIIGKSRYERSIEDWVKDILSLPSHSHSFSRFFFFSKDHQWTGGDNKNQQKIGIGAGTLNNTSSPWSNSPSMSTPFGGVRLQSSNLSPLIFLAL